MKKYKAFHCSCVGESHLATGKPCQDYSSSQSKQYKNYAMAIVSDGHGGTRYFRSDKGAQLAVNITNEVLKDFLEETKFCKSLLKGKSGAFGEEDEIENSKIKIYESFKTLISSIITRWNREIREDALNRPLTQWEKDNVEEKYLKEFEDTVRNESFEVEKTYGCTLMAFVMTKLFWLAFQIGDGKMVCFFLDDRKKITPCQPVPWDEKCFLNKTTSICDSNAAAEFRFAFSGKGDKPLAVFLGSDGIDDTYGDDNRLTDFYIRLYKELVRNGKEKTKKMLETDLPQLSKIGSRDDMSIAGIYNCRGRVMKRNALLMSKWQLERLDERDLELDAKIEELTVKIGNLEDKLSLSEAQEIELRYARNDFKRALDAKDKIQQSRKQIEEFDKSLTSKNG